MELVSEPPAIAKLSLPPPFPPTDSPSCFAISPALIFPVKLSVMPTAKETLPLACEPSIITADCSFSF